MHTVVAADGCRDARIFGDTLCERMKQRYVQVAVTDGVVCDLVGVLETELPVWAAGAAAPPSGTGMRGTAKLQDLLPILLGCACESREFASTL